MNQKEFVQDHLTSDTKNTFRMNRGLRWAVMSFIAIILTIIVAAGSFFLMPNNFFNRVNENTNTGAPMDK